VSGEKLKDAPDQTPPEAAGALEPPSELDKVTAEKAEWQDRALRVQADFQNFRRRMEKEKVELLEYASTEAIRPLLVVLDDFERALKTESSDKEYAKGMDLIYQRFFDALKKLGLEPIESVGNPFDPHLHHAIDMVETTDAPDHTVLEEFQRAYNFKGKLLRPAMVKVAVKPPSK
jgi:molecular chaperone GrpE